MQRDDALALDASEVLARWRAAEPAVEEATAQAILGALLLGGDPEAASEALLQFDPELPVTLQALRSLRNVLHDELHGVPEAEAVNVFAALDHLVTRVADRDIAKVAALTLLDPLTSLGNRRAADADLAGALAHAERHGRTVSIAILDLDGLKRINDEHGHHAGDLALRRLADALRASARLDDGVYRLGGDEFLVIAANSSALDLERLLRRVAAVSPAFSAGIASAPTDALEPEPLLAAADRRLYQRKPPRNAHPIRRSGQPWSDLAGVLFVFALASVLAELLRRLWSIDLRGARVVAWTVLLLGAPLAATAADAREGAWRADSGAAAWRAAALALALVAALVPLAAFR